MRFRTILLATCTVFVGVVSANSSVPHFPSSSLPRYVSSLAPQAPDTADLYRINCQMCHGPLGKAPLPEMAFVGRKWKHGTRSSDMAKVIREGVLGTPMMPFKSKLTPAQITALAKYVRAFDKTLKPEK